MTHADLVLAALDWLARVEGERISADEAIRFATEYADSFEGEPSPPSLPSAYRAFQVS